MKEPTRSANVKLSSRSKAGVCLKPMRSLPRSDTEKLGLLFKILLVLSAVGKVPVQEAGMAGRIGKVLYPDSFSSNLL